MLSHCINLTELLFITLLVDSSNNEGSAFLMSPTHTHTTIFTSSSIICFCNVYFLKLLVLNLSNTESISWLFILWEEDIWVPTARLPTSTSTSKLFVKLYCNSYRSAGDWFQDLPRIPTSMDAQVLKIKWCRTVHSRPSVSTDSQTQIENTVVFFGFLKIYGWLNPQVQNSRIWRANCNLTLRFP